MPTVLSLTMPAESPRCLTCQSTSASTLVRNIAVSSSCLFGSYLAFYDSDALDALGNTTAAVGKGFAVGSAVLTAVSLLTTFTVRVGIANTLDPINSNFFIPGVLVGAMLPYCFAALTMGAVAAAAGSVVIEVRRQLNTIVGECFLR